MAKLNIKSADYFFISIVLAVTLLFIDLQIPLGVAFGVSYVAVIFISLFSNQKKYLLLAAIICTIFVLIGFIASPSGSEEWKVYLNRSLSIFLIWLSTLTGILILKSRKDLSESEAMVRKIFDSMFSFVGLISIEGILIDANKAAIERASLKREDVIGKFFIDTYWCSYSSDVQNRLQKALHTAKKGEVVRYDERVRAGENEFITIDLVLSPLYDKHGNISQFLGSAIDITDRKNIEKKLQSSEEKYRAMFETSQVGMALCNMDGSLIEVNQGYLDIIGYSKDEALKLTYWEITPPRYEAQEKEQLQSILETGQYGPYEKEYIHKNGSTVPVLLNGSLIKDEDNNECIWSTVHDISELKKAGEKLTYQASHDDLTDLINRREFERRAERLLLTIGSTQSSHALCFMDLDQFKVVNDTCGHMAGDEMLRQLTTELKNVVRVRDTLARLGGDEFGVLMEHCSLDDAHRVAISLQKTIQDYQFAWEGQTFKVGVSIGLVAITEMTPNLTELLKDADAACYMAKDQGRNRIHVSHADDIDIAQRHGEMQWVARLNHALEEDRFCLYAQIIEPLDTANKNIHYELLIRMLDDSGEIIPPGAFLPAAERYNLISKVDYWVIEHAFDLLANNPTFLEDINFCSINLSGASLTNPDVLDFIVVQLDKSSIDGHKICFEITETAAISNLSMAMKFISTLKELGCRFALDDFGSGLSSFAYLKNLPVDFLKIDGMFVKDIADDPIDHAMVKSINEIGQVMGMKTIAEFVENDEIKGMLREIGVNYAQGYGIGKPLPLNDLLVSSNHIKNNKDS